MFSALAPIADLARSEPRELPEMNGVFAIAGFGTKVRQAANAGHESRGGNQLRWAPPLLTSGGAALDGDLIQGVAS